MFPPLMAKPYPCGFGVINSANSYTDLHRLPTWFRRFISRQASLSQSPLDPAVDSKNFPQIE